ncbi:MAG: acyl-CoA thioesterase [Bacteroidaceae bacterium]|nr:acyl-CoA thioesterase [Bacteroidaceae bacterium]
MLTVEKAFDIRFSEIDMMQVVWHGTYPVYLEDAREAFGNRYGLSYQRYMVESTFAPIVEMKLNYKRPLKYGMKPIVKITYHPTESAKIVFDYEIRDSLTGEVCLTAHTVQVFMDKQYQLLWENPPFYEAWKQKMVELYPESMAD